MSIQSAFAAVLDDETNETMEKYWRIVIDPDTELAGLADSLGVAAGVATRLGAIITAARYPEAVARFEARKVVQGG